MKTSSPAIVASIGVFSIGLMSCATLNKAGSASVALLKKTSAATTSKVAELSEISMARFRPAGVKVVAVREKDLKTMPTGAERALAFQNSQNPQISRKKKFWLFDGPVDFKEPTLPVGGMELDGSLLPPKEQ
jgi:hypothetical protein